MVKIYIRVKSVWLEPGTMSMTYFDEIMLSSTLNFWSQELTISDFVKFVFWVSKKWDIIQSDGVRPKREVIKIDIFLE